MRTRRRVVQVDRRSNSVRNAAGVREKFGVEPARIPDLLALVGDAADGYPGIPGIGKVTAARLVNRYGSLEDFPPDVLGEQRDLALLFKDLATLRCLAPGPARGRRAPLARPDSGVRGLDGASRRRAPARPLARGRRSVASDQLRSVRRN